MNIFPQQYVFPETNNAPEYATLQVLRLTEVFETCKAAAV